MMRPFVRERCTQNARRYMIAIIEVVGSTSTPTTRTLLLTWYHTRKPPLPLLYNGVFDRIAIRLKIRDPTKSSSTWSWYDDNKANYRHIFGCESGCNKALSSLLQTLHSCCGLTYLVQSSLGREDRDLVVVVRIRRHGSATTGSKWQSSKNTLPLSL